jgi:hypothetical protein
MTSGARSSGLKELRHSLAFYAQLLINLLKTRSVALATLATLYQVLDHRWVGKELWCIHRLGEAKADESLGVRLVPLDITVTDGRRVLRIRTCNFCDIGA